jgi:hypothetical protein
MMQSFRVLGSQKRSLNEKDKRFPFKYLDEFRRYEREAMKSAGRVVI